MKGSGRNGIVTEMFVPILSFFPVLSRFVYISCKYLLKGCPVRRCASYPSSHITSRAKERILPRVDGQPSLRCPPTENFPGWAIRQ